MLFFPIIPHFFGKEGRGNLACVIQKHRYLLDTILKFSPIFHITFSI